MITTLAVLAGADGFVAIEHYGRAKQSWLETFDLPHGIKDTRLETSAYPSTEY